MEPLVRIHRVAGPPKPAGRVRFSPGSAVQSPSPSPGPGPGPGPSGSPGLGSRMDPS